MTFIASVIAKDGVAIIADSLVTSMNQVVEWKEFAAFLKNKIDNSGGQNVSLNPVDILNLFNKKPSHTKDFEDKLFQYDKYTAITTAGAAYINGKSVGKIVIEISKELSKIKGHLNKTFERRVKEFSEKLNEYTKKHLEKNQSIQGTTFIFTSFDKLSNKTKICKVNVEPNDSKKIKDLNFNCVNIATNADVKIVCDGQNRISERILLGEFEFFHDVAPRIVRKVIDDLKIDSNNIPANYIQDFANTSYSIWPVKYFDDVKMYKIAELSLQQAVDLAALLMRIEINFQKYTENIPTVGGVIKIAVINNEGFQWINGNEIVRPEGL